jgi:putative DNA primase/helicase
MSEEKASAHLRFLNSSMNHNKQIAGLKRLCRLGYVEWGDDVALDADPMLLGCANGVVDLSTGLLRPGRRADLITKSTGLSFDASAPCPRFESFLDEIFDGDKDLVCFLRRAFGYTLTGQTCEQIMLLLHGAGANGKSVLVEALKSVLGTYATTTPFSTFEEKRRNEATNDLAALAGARLVAASESEETSGLNESRIKRLTGGDDVTARFLFQEFFTYTPTFKIWLALNHKPVVRGSDDGIWRRLLLVPFEVSFRGREDPHLLDTLRAEAQGILSWGVQGCLEWQVGGLEPPEKVKSGTDEYRQESNLVGQFLGDWLEIAEGASIPSTRLYRAYQAWCLQNGVRPWSHVRFARRLTELGIKRDRNRHGSIYIGLRLLPNAQTTEEDGEIAHGDKDGEQPLW